MLHRHTWSRHSRFQRAKRTSGSSDFAKSATRQEWNSRWFSNPIPVREAQASRKSNPTTKQGRTLRMYPYLWCFKTMFTALKKPEFSITGSPEIDADIFSASRGRNFRWLWETVSEHCES